MDNQHTKIKGYRDLSQTEIDLMNRVKEKGEEIGAIVQTLKDTPGLDQRWVSEGKTDLQKGIMSLVRAIAQPTSFVLAGLLLLAGCSGGKKHISWPMESNVDGTTRHFHNAVQLDIPVDTFHAVNSWSWMEVCKTRLENPVSQDEHMYPFEDCKMTTTPINIPLASAAQQLVTPVAVAGIQAGGMVGMGYFLKEGLRKSGSNVQQNSNGNGNAEAHSKSDADANHLQNVGNSTKNINPVSVKNINSNNVIKVK